MGRKRRRGDDHHHHHQHHQEHDETKTKDSNESRSRRDWPPLPAHTPHTQTTPAAAAAASSQQQQEERHRPRPRSRHQRRPPRPPPYHPPRISISTFATLPQQPFSSLFFFFTCCCLLLFPSPVAAGDMYRMGTDSITGSTKAVENLGKTEGCFSKFEPLLSKVYNAVELDNRVCQVYCASQRFTVSATSRTTCYCGNSYPSAFFKVKDDLCDNPCSPDKTYCFVYACCGSKDGTYFTVAFAGQLDPVLQLLRQLTYDYRTHNPMLRAHIKTLMGASAPLQVMSSGGLASGVVMSGGAGIGLQGSCPDHYSEFQGNCYTRAYGSMMSYAQAKAKCAEDGASLAVVQSQPENDYLTQMLYQKPGWLGLNNKGLNAFQWDEWTNWGLGEPSSSNGFVTKLPASGAATGDAFNDQNNGVRNIRQLAIYSSSRLLGIQGRYLYTNGSEIIGWVMGSNKGGDTAIISLTYGQYVAAAFGEIVNNNIQTLNIVVKDVKGNSITYGPYGSSSGGGATKWSVNATGLVVGFYGFANAQGITQLGFYDLQAPRCTQIAPGGGWRTVPCAQSFDGVSYACQLRPTASKVDCPSGGWFRYGEYCYKAFSGNKLSWESARLSCLTMQSTLVTVSTPEMNAFFASRFQGSYGFIGFKDRVPMGQTNRSFVWETYTNWATGQPVPLPRASASSTTNSANGGGCVVMDPNQAWSVIDCGATTAGRTVVCELVPADNYCTCPSGWTAFGCRCYMVVNPSSTPGTNGAFAGGVSWISASQACQQLGGGLLDVNSPGESTYISTRLAKSQSVFVGRRDVFNSGIFLTNSYTSWALGEPIDNLGTVNGGGNGLCGVLRGDSQWYGFPCTSAFSQAVCKRPKASPVGGQINTGEEFTMVAVDQTTDPQWGVPLDVFLQHTATGAYLGIDGAGNVFTSTSRSDDAKLQVMEAKNATGFNIRSKNYDFYLRLDSSEGRLVTVDSYAVDDGFGGGGGINSGYRSLTTAATAGGRAAAAEGGGAAAAAEQQQLVEGGDIGSAKDDDPKPKPDPEPEAPEAPKAPKPLPEPFPDDPLDDGIFGRQRRARARARAARASGQDEEEQDGQEGQDEQEQQQEPSAAASATAARGRRRRRQRQRKAQQMRGAATPAPTTSNMNMDAIDDATKPSVFTSMKSFGPISVQNLQIGLAVQKSQSMPYPRYCSLKIYDLTATSDSFSCYYIQGDTSNMPMVDLAVESFTIQDKTTNMNPRTPLQNGRTKCENQSPTDTLTCTFAYGEGLTFSTALAVTWGQNYANQFQVESGGQQGSVWYNYLYAFDNQYTSITTNTYVESRNWAVNVPVPPLTVCTMQFWLSSVDVQYVWQSILKATGSFDLSANGVYFGNNYALSDISNPWDLHVYQWGRYSAASQAEVIITTDEVQAAKYQLQVPAMNNV